MSNQHFRILTGVLCTRSYDRALAVEPLKPSLHANRGMALAALGSGESALRALRQATTLDPEHPAYWNYYAVLLQQSARTGEAARARQRAEKMASRPAPGSSPSLSMGSGSNR